MKVILYALYKLNCGKSTFFGLSFVKRIQNDVQDEVMHDAK